MSTTSSCNLIRHAATRCAVEWCLLLCVPFLSSCAYSGGELLYVLGVGKGELVKAQFTITDGPVLILIDDPAQRMGWPPMPNYLFNELAQQLLKNNAAKKLIPRQTLDRLRQSDSKFSTRGCREIGESAGAEQVLWIEVQDCRAEEQVTEMETAAFFTAAVRVINVLETESPSRVRLWPQNPGGTLVSVSMTGSEVGIAKSKEEVGKQLAVRAAEAVAKFFYDHRLGEFERKE